MNAIKYVLALSAVLVACGDPEIRAKCNDVQYPCVKLRTSEGIIWVKLDTVKAPASTSNFLRYLDKDFYDDTIFHRIVGNFVIQGGGFELADDEKKSPAYRMRLKETLGSVVNESLNGLSNKRGTIAMARTSNPNSATSQFYINLIDNINLDGRGANPGYTVFGEVIKGMDIVDKIGKARTTSRQGYTNVPKKPVHLIKATRV